MQDFKIANLPQYIDNGDEFMCFNITIFEEIVFAILHCKSLKFIFIGRQYADALGCVDEIKSCVNEHDMITLDKCHGKKLMDSIFDLITHEIDSSLIFNFRSYGEIIINESGLQDLFINSDIQNIGEIYQRTVKILKTTRDDVKETM